MKPSYRAPKTLTASLMTVALFAGGANAGVIFNSNFSFLSGTPVSGTLTQEGVAFTVATTNTEMFNPGDGLTAFKNLGGQDALVTFTFSEVITDFSFIVGRVANDEFIDNFLLGNDSSSLSTLNPAITSGDLIASGSGSAFRVSTTNSVDNGGGTLSWTGLTNTKVVQFTIDVAQPSSAALDVASFTATAVPEPSTFLYLASLSLATILGFGAFRRKRR
jgi:hypothetical protein